MKKFLFALLFLFAATLVSATEKPEGSFVGEPKITFAPNGTKIVTTDFILKPGDTTLVVDTYGALAIEITVRDSSNSMTDSVRAYQGNGNDTTFYSLLSLHDCAQTTTTTNVDIMNGADNSTKTFKVVGSDYVRKLLLARLNAGTTAQGFLYPAWTRGSVKVIYPLY